MYLQSKYPRISKSRMATCILDSFFNYTEALQFNHSTHNDFYDWLARKTFRWTDTKWIRVNEYAVCRPDCRNDALGNAIIFFERMNAIVNHIILSLIQ